MDTGETADSVVEAGGTALLVDTVGEHFGSVWRPELGDQKLEVEFGRSWRPG